MADLVPKADTSDVSLFFREKHVDYIMKYDQSKTSYEYVMTEYLRMSGMYWGLTAVDLLSCLDRIDSVRVIDFVKSCQHDSGGFAASPGHDPHLLHSLSAVQILLLFDKLDVIEVDSLIAYVVSRQLPDGSFTGDESCEVDTRFTFCAVACLALLGRLDVLDIEAAVRFLLACRNFDGGFGAKALSESHAGQVYCCVAALSILGRLHEVDAEMLGWWLCERQLPSGGLNGRPEKLADVCYSWWVLASLAIIGKLFWISSERLASFILSAQDSETGGFADRPGDMVDPFHTLFGIAGLSLLGWRGLKPVNPVFCMPQSVIDRAGIAVQLL